MATIGMQLRWRGLNELAARWRDASRHLTAAVERPIRASQNRVYLGSQRLCPVDKGNLKASGRKTDIGVVNRRVTGEVQYGGIVINGVRVNYALWQHENLHYRHRVGQAKYLETAVVYEREETIQDLAREYRALLAGRDGGRSASVISGTPV